MKLPETDVERVGAIVAAQALNADMPQRYLRELPQRAELPQQWIWEVAGRSFGDLGGGARELVRWAAAKGANPRDARYTALGSLIRVLLHDVGPDIGAVLVAVVLRHRLYYPEQLRADLAASYQAPEPAVATGTDAFPVPSLAAGDDDDVQLQARAPKTPALLDVGYLTEAIRHAASVCRVEDADGTAWGTGFLIAPDLAVTCQHVVDRAGTKNLRLRFRCVTARDGAVSELAAVDPVVWSSPRNELDCAVLRLAAVPDARAGVTTATLAEARRDTDLSVLQHPGGETLKLAVSLNAMVRLDPDRGTARYVTTTAGGSSGAPCFDENWQVVAVHRAERAAIFGAVREGTLTQAIRPHLAALL